MVREKRAEGITSTVYEYFKDHRGVEVNVNDMADATYLTKQQIFGAITNLRKKGITIKAPIKGWYLYTHTDANGSKAVTMKSKAEVITLLESGDLLLNVEGKLYIASELEIQ